MGPRSLRGFGVCLSFDRLYIVTKGLSLSIVIPVYNEENHLTACLDAVAKQIVMPNEVIVVDNNSTDRSISIAKSYSFVKILHEKKQHQTYAQRLGFDMAKGDIIGRIDADTVLPRNWTKKVIRVFEQSRDTLAITGDADPYDVPLKFIGSFAFRLYHQLISKLFSGHTMLWGGNMAIRKSAWQSVRDRLAYRPDIWEDYELSFALARLGKISHVAGLKVSCSFRAAHHPLAFQARYQFRAVRTFSLHVSKLRTVLFSIAWYTMIWVAPFAVVDRYLWRFKESRNNRQ